MRESVLQFEHNGRTYDCQQTGEWWWFAVTGDQHRYAPFHASADDESTSVQDRIVTYYEALLAHRAAPAPQRHWGAGRPGRPPAAVQAARAAASSEEGEIGHSGPDD
jgi:hypothetical protein